jgi:hypothetical protein
MAAWCSKKIGLALVAGLPETEYFYDIPRVGHLKQKHCGRER